MKFIIILLFLYSNLSLAVGPKSLEDQSVDFFLTCSEKDFSKINPKDAEILMVDVSQKKKIFEIINTIKVRYPGTHAWLCDLIKQPVSVYTIIRLRIFVKKLIGIHDLLSKGCLPKLYHEIYFWDDNVSQACKKIRNPSRSITIAQQLFYFAINFTSQRSIETNILASALDRSSYKTHELDEICQEAKIQIAQFFEAKKWFSNELDVLVAIISTGIETSKIAQLTTEILAAYQSLFPSSCEPLVDSGARRTRILIALIKQAAKKRNLTTIVENVKRFLPEFFKGQDDDLREHMTPIIIGLINTEAGITLEDVIASIKKYLLPRLTRIKKSDAYDAVGVFLGSSVSEFHFRNYFEACRPLFDNASPVALISGYAFVTLVKNLSGFAYRHEAMENFIAICSAHSTTLLANFWDVSDIVIALSEFVTCAKDVEDYIAVIAENPEKLFSYEKQDANSDYTCANILHALNKLPKNAVKFKIFVSNFADNIDAFFGHIDTKNKTTDAHLKRLEMKRDIIAKLYAEADQAPNMAAYINEEAARLMCCRNAETVFGSY